MPAEGQELNQVYWKRVTRPKITNLQLVATYRVNQQLADLGWVDIDLDVSLILPSGSAHSAKPESGRK